jgi:hypothetical protein
MNRALQLLMQQKNINQLSPKENFESRNSKSTTRGIFMKRNKKGGKKKGKINNVASKYQKSTNPILKTNPYNQSEKP